MYELSALGFGPSFEQQLQPGDDRAAIPARIAAEHRGAYEVWSQAGAGPAQLAGRLRLELEEAGLPGVGDWVVLREVPGPDRTTIIDRMLARRTARRRATAPSWRSTAWGSRTPGAGRRRSPRPKGRWPRHRGRVTPTNRSTTCTSWRAPTPTPATRTRRSGCSSACSPDRTSSRRRGCGSIRAGTRCGAPRGSSG